MPARATLADREGSTIVEFAFVMPIFMLVIIGCLDVGQMVYGIGVLDGAVEKAARDSTLETGDTSIADGKVRDVIGEVLPGAIVSSTRESYYAFSDVGRPERWNDANNDGNCSTGETYVDENGNGSWDSEIGESGNGGANDVVVYKVTVRYDPVFAIPLVPLNWNTREISSTTVHRNQPFALQEGRGSASGTC
nr:TadE/TadG family type IV pilus assembly protein [Novosphingobium hassiacum]